MSGSKDKAYGGINAEEYHAGDQELPNLIVANQKLASVSVLPMVLNIHFCVYVNYLL